MTFRIDITDSAKADLREIYYYIAEVLKNPPAAKRRLLLLEARIQSLKIHPAQYRLVRDEYLAAQGFRLIVVKTHLVFFIIREKSPSVRVMRVLYGRKDWLSQLRIEATELEEGGLSLPNSEIRGS